MTVRSTYEVPCPSCQAYGSTTETSADGRSYSFPCLACGGSGWLRRKTEAD